MLPSFKVSAQSNKFQRINPTNGFRFVSRRYGGLENGRFCFEGGSRCCKGEGVHVLRVDDPDDLQHAFDAATKGKLESKRKSVYKTSKSSTAIA